VRDLYLEVPYQEAITPYVVAETDINSTPGVIYVSVDPTYIHDKSTEKTDENSGTAADYWFNGGGE
jgi:hypothetical protein